MEWQRVAHPAKLARLIICVDFEAEGDFDAVPVVFGQQRTGEPTDGLGDPFHDSYVPVRRAFNEA